ncbi:MAG: hypothetical protein JWO62_829 [Acidimicrobiaceae bacterium]|jgi:hypothetical protein|nr:hypothetical protein [Acidimicrobiaceae bacterium]
MYRGRRLLAAAVIVASSAAVPLLVGGPAFASPGPGPCRHLSGTFSVVVSSQGAGNVTYALRLRDQGLGHCVVSGLAQLRLLSRSGAPLPTRVTAASPGSLTAMRVVLHHGSSAWASARFSPDVPGTGEPTNGQCEPTAYRVDVTVAPAGARLAAPISPPTPVCEHGLLQLSALGTKRPTA